MESTWFCLISKGRKLRTPKGTDLQDSRIMDVLGPRLLDPIRLCKYHPRSVDRMKRAGVYWLPPSFSPKPMLHFFFFKKTRISQFSKVTLIYLASLLAVRIHTSLAWLYLVKGKSIDKTSGDQRMLMEGVLKG